MADPAGFEALYRRAYPLVLRYAERRVSDDEVARELAAETFLLAWRKLDPAADHALPWLYATAHNLIGTRYRAEEREREALAALARADAPALDAAERAQLVDAVRTLPEKDREALYLTHWEGLSAQEVARVLNCSEAAAWKRLSRATATLRLRLQGTPKAVNDGRD